MTRPSSPPNRRTRILVLVAIVAVAVGVGYWLWGPNRKPKPDPVAATATNARGVGLMEQFRYPEAAAEFEKASTLAPDWIPARINWAIALYNSAASADDRVLDRATKLFEQILKEEPENPYAHFNLGIIRKYRGEYSAAATHFLRVIEIDPTDDRAWLYLGQSDPDMQSSAEAKRHFEKALELNPYLIPARYAIANHLLTTPEEQKRLHDSNERLRLANWEDEARADRHSEQGRYATVIGRGLTKPADVGPLPMFEQESRWTLPEGLNWDRPGMRKDNAEDRLRTALFERYGGTVVLFDFNGDGKPDALLLSAVVRDGKPGDLLLVNTGTGFVDRSAEAGLTGPGSLAAAVGDYDNDGRPDLVLSTPTGLRLLRNVDGKRFEEKTVAAGFDKAPGVYFSLCWLDIDQDGDLDLIAGRYADSAEAAAGGRVVAFLNAGVAPPSRDDESTPPLTTAFKPFDFPPFPQPGRVVGLIATDIDGDKDVDLIVLREGLPPEVILNDRLLRFRIDSSLRIDATDVTGGLVLDANGDDQSDLFFTSNSKPRLYVSRQDQSGNSLAERFGAGATDSPPLRSARRCDLDADGRADVVGLTKDRKPIFLQGDGAGKLSFRSGVFGPAVNALSNVVAVAVADFKGDGTSDLFVWTEAGVKLFLGLGNGNHNIRLTFSGKRDSSNLGSGQKNLRTNSDGIGTKFQSITGSLLSRAELTTLSSGPGQSLLPIEVGLGRAERIDALRVRWPDGVVQAELALPSDGVTVVRELNRKPTSCPVLMTWDGTKWVYVTDFLGGGALGESGSDGSVRPPRPEESVKIEPHQLGMKNGWLEIRIAEPMDEVLYLDHVRLAVIDHPAGTEIYPDERFATADPQPTQAFLTFRSTIAPVRAVDHRGTDFTSTVAHRDGKTVDGFAHRTWMGFAEDHWLEIDFGDRMKDLPSDRPLYLVLAGWTDYPYPESINAAAQAGLDMIPPVLERQKADGTWERLGDLGFPAGLPKVMTVPVGEWVKPGRADRFRIRTNLQIYWDRIALGVAEPTAQVRELKPLLATLSHPGFVQEIKSGGKPPQAYDPNTFETVAVSRWKGRLTKLGDVTELLAETDDRFVICGPGDEVAISFDASSLPVLPTGWQRSYVVRNFGYCKDTSPTTVTGGEVLPLPYRQMTAYPPKVANPRAAEDLVRWHIRP